MVRMMNDMCRLALQTDSTRVITLFLGSVRTPGVTFDDGRTLGGYHNLSHHGKDEVKLESAWKLKTHKWNCSVSFCGILRASMRWMATCLITQWFSMAVIWAMPIFTIIPTSQSFLPVVGFGTGSTSHSTHRTTPRYAMSLSACSRTWESRLIDSPAVLDH